MHPTEMRKTLLRLCELQLASILDAFDGAVLDTAARATEALALFDDPTVQNAGRVAVAPVRTLVHAIVTRLQFHDELSQRSAHLHQLLALLRQSDERLPRDKAQLAALLGSLFSTQAEFALLRQVLPDQPLPMPGAGIELF